MKVIFPAVICFLSLPLYNIRVSGIEIWSGVETVSKFEAAVNIIHDNGETSDQALLSSDKCFGCINIKSLEVGNGQF